MLGWLVPPLQWLRSLPHQWRHKCSGWLEKGTVPLSTVERIGRDEPYNARRVEIMVSCEEHTHKQTFAGTTMLKTGFLVI